MTKKVFQFLLMVVVSLGLCQGFVSCSDKDDDEESGNGAQTEQEQDASMAFWAVVGQLTSIDQMDANYQDKQFEPTIGEASHLNKYVRIVATNDMETAAQRFASLVGVSIDANTENYTWKNDEVGTLTYNKTPAGGTSLATVDVEIKQMPHLQQIVYCTPEQVGENASVPGVPYYRFGDVVSRKNDRGKTEYWICVRPAFGPEGKKKSHWVTTSPLPKKNLHKIEKGGRSYWVPTTLGRNEEQMQNFAEMLYAMLNPTQWEKNITEVSPYRNIFNKGVPMFHDFSKSKVNYHNRHFWVNVDKGWKETAEGGAATLYERVFGFKADNLRAQLNNDGLNLLTDGYSWWSSVSWNLTLYRTKYTNGEGKKLNMHNQESGKLTKTLSTSDNFDVSDGYPQDSPYLSFADENCFIIRNATGDDLCGRTADVYQSFSTQNQELTDVYVYNKKYAQKVGRDENYGVSLHLEKPHVGCFIGKDGKYYGTKADAETSSGQAVAMVVFYDPTHPVDVLGYHGLAIALNDVQSDDTQWSKGQSTGSCLDNSDRNMGVGSSAGFTNGVMSTRLLGKSICDGRHTHTAAQVCDGLEPINQPGFSPWFLPAMGQWLRAMVGLGIVWDNNADVFQKGQRTNLETINDYFNAENGCQPLAGSYWTANDFDSNTAWSISLSGNPFTFEKSAKATANKVRPFVAFDTTGLEKDNGVDKSKAQVGYILAENGKFYKSLADVWLSRQQGVAIVVVANNNGVEKGTNYTGLAMAQHPSEQQYAWGGDNYACFIGNNKDVDGCDRFFGEEGKGLNGLEITQRLQADKCPDCGQAHPAFQAAKNFPSLLTTEVRQQKGYSQWFIPSTAQIILMLESFNFKRDWYIDNYMEDSGNDDTRFFEDNVSIFAPTANEKDFLEMSRTLRMAGFKAEDNCWTANRYKTIEPKWKKKAWSFVLRMKEWSESTPISFSIRNTRNDEMRIWPMLAF